MNASELPSTSARFRPSLFQANSSDFSLHVGFDPTGPSRKSSPILLIVMYRNRFCSSAIRYRRSESCQSSTLYLIVPCTQLLWAWLTGHAGLQIALSTDTWQLLHMSGDHACPLRLELTHKTNTYHFHPSTLANRISRNGLLEEVCTHRVGKFANRLYSMLQGMWIYGQAVLGWYFLI